MMEQNMKEIDKMMKCMVKVFMLQQMELKKRVFGHKVIKLYG